MTSQVAGGEAIFEETCVSFSPFLGKKCAQNVVKYLIM